MSRVGVSELSAITISRRAPSASAGLIGVFRRVPPSKYQRRPSAPSTGTAGNSRGIAAEARTWSSVSSVLT